MNKIEDIDFKLEKFEGPLDLLLQLIEKNKFDIFDIPIVEITEQYLQYVESMQREDIDLMSDFLVMAATLISIKSKMLLPKEEEAEEDEEDPRAELVRRLLEYKVYKYASYELKDMGISSGTTIYKGASIPEDVKKYKEPVDTAKLVEESDVTIIRLHDIFETLLKREINRVDPVRSKFGTITREEIRLEDRMTEIAAEVKGLESINFKTIIGSHRTKINIIVSFLAILELLKIGKIAIRQESQFGDILIDSLE